MSQDEVNPNITSKKDTTHVSLRPISRINVNKYTFMTLIFCRLCIHQKKNKREKNVQSVRST